MDQETHPDEELGDLSGSGAPRADPPPASTEKAPEGLRKWGRRFKGAFYALVGLVGGLVALYEDVPKVWPALVGLAVLVWIFCAFVLWLPSSDRLGGWSAANWLYSSQARRWALGGFITTFALLFLIGGALGGQEAWSQLNRPDLVVAVARFDGPDDVHGLSSQIITELEQLDLDPSRISVKPLDRVIRSEEGAATARAVGEEVGADLVIWGWYRVPGDSSVISMRVEVLRTPLLNGEGETDSDNLSMLHQAVVASEQFSNVKVQRAAASDLVLFMYIHIQLTLLHDAFEEGEHANFDLLRRQLRKLEKALESRSGGVFFKGHIFEEWFERMPCTHAGLMLVGATSAFTEAELEDLSAGRSAAKRKHLEFLGSIEKILSTCSVWDETAQARFHHFLADGYHANNVLSEDGLVPGFQGALPDEVLRPPPDIDLLIRHHYNQAVALDSSRMFARAKYYWLIGDYPASIEDYSVAIALDTLGVEVVDSARVARQLRLRGEMQILLGMYYYCEMYHSHDPWIPDALDTSRIPVLDAISADVSALGFLYKGIQDYRREARYRYYEADLVDAYVREAMVWAHLGKPKLAIAALDKYLAQRPNDVDGLVERASMHERFGHYELAAADFNQASEIDSTNLRLPQHRNRMYEALIQEATTGWNHERYLLLEGE